MSHTRTYIMDNHREGQRLLDKVDAGSWISKYLKPHLKDARVVLSVGCGPGVFLPELAAMFPNAEFIGVDISEDRIEQAQLRLAGVPNARVQVGDARSLPLQSDSVDFVFCRFLMEYLPDKPGAVREMARVCRQGGKILLQDLDGQLLWHFPEDPELQQTIERVVRGLERSGFDPFVGRKLFSLCVQASLAEIHVQIDPYHLYAGRIDEKELSQWRTKLEIAKPQVKKILGSDEAATRYSEKFLEYLRRPDTLTYSCLFSVLGTKPAQSTT